MENYKIKVIDILKIFIMINFISSIGIPCLGHYVDNISMYYFIINVISTLIFIIFKIFKKGINFTGFWLYGVLYYCVLIISTVINNGNIYSLMCEAELTLTLLFIWNELSKEEFSKVIGSICFIMEILALSNLFVVIMFPDGLYNIEMSRNYYIFDHVNVAIRYLLPGTCLTLIRSISKKNKIDLRSWIYIAVVIATLILTRPITAIIGYFVFLLLFFVFYNIEKTPFIMRPICSLALSGGISFSIIVIQIQNFFSKFIENVLHRDITFTGRTAIWERALKLIKEKMILGNGRMSMTDRILNLGVSSAHNQFLNFLFEGGMVLLTVIIFMFKSVSKKLEKCKNKKIVVLLKATLFSYVVMWITEPFSYSGTSLMFLILLIAYRSNELFENKERKN